MGVFCFADGAAWVSSDVDAISFESLINSAPPESDLVEQGSLAL